MVEGSSSVERNIDGKVLSPPSYFQWKFEDVWLLEVVKNLVFKIEWSPPVAISKILWSREGLG
jgi:hypothetical protein